LFALLHEDTMIRIFSNLNLLEAHQSATVCQRWRHVLASNDHKRSIRHVDATEFLHHAHDACVSSCNSAAAASAVTTTASQILEREITLYRPDRLTIRTIGHRLSSELCIIPNVHRLVELTLTHYDALTDLTLHAMLLLTSATPPSSTDPDVWMHEHGRVQRTSGTSLQTLRLEHCPLLSDTAVRSIALTCPNLHVLSLRGCRSIESIVPLRALWKVAATTSPVLINNVTSPTGLSVPSSTSSGKQIGSAAPLSLASLFVATSATTAAHPARAAAQRMGRSRPPHVESVFAVLPPPSPTSVATIVNEAEEEATEGGPDLAWDANANRTSPLCLADRFAAPSMSAKSVPAPSPAFRSIVGSSSAALQGPRCGGSLIDLDVSDTGVPPAALLDALRSTRGPTSVALFPTKVHLERLMARGSATTSGDCQLWMPRQLEELADLIHVAAVKETDVGIFETTTSSNEPQTPCVAHAGIRSH
jgi:hypothetical protein